MGKIYLSPCCNFSKFATSPIIIFIANASKTPSPNSFTRALTKNNFHFMIALFMICAVCIVLVHNSLKDFYANKIILQMHIIATVHIYAQCDSPSCRILTPAVDISSGCSRLPLSVVLYWDFTASLHCNTGAWVSSLKCQICAWLHCSSK